MQRQSCGSTDREAAVEATMIVPEDELPPMSEVERMARRELVLGDDHRCVDGSLTVGTAAPTALPLTQR